MSQQHTVFGVISTSSSFLDSKSKEWPRTDSQFKWNDIKNFLFIADAMASTVLNYNIFAEVTIQVPVYLLVLFSVLFGMPYMCMDTFIKVYTGKIDLQESLSPLLKALHCGMLVQTILWTFLHANDLADCICYFFITVKPIPTWSVCTKHFTEQCVPTSTIKITCDTLIASNKTMHSHLMSSHHHYMRMFKTGDRTVFTRKLFVLIVVWISNFLLCTISDQVLVKIFNLSFLFRNISTLFALVYLIITAGEHLSDALKNILNFDRHASISITASVVLYEFGVGLVGVYDFGIVSPFLIVDNAVIMFAISFTLLAFMRSVLVAMLCSLMKLCVKIRPLKGDKFISYHYFLFALMPLGADFLYFQRLFTMYLFVNLTITLCVHICAVTFVVSKVLQSQFPQVKSVYLTGSICFFGFLFSIPAGLDIDQYTGYLKGLSNGMLILGALKSIVVMYIYGIQKFATDIHFWLGFKPTKYWIITWRLMPFFLMLVSVRWLSKIRVELMTPGQRVLVGMCFLLFILILVLLMELRTSINFLALNNLTALFRSSAKYGPPDTNERKNRKNFNKDLSVQQCTHACVLIDDTFDCNHMPIIFKTQFDEDDDKNDLKEGSMMQVYKANTSRKGRLSVVVDPQATND